MSKKAKKRNFKGSVRKDAEKRRKGIQYGHLNLPKGISIFKEEPGSRISLDIMPYVVTMPNHPDRNDEYNNALPEELWYKRPYWLHRNIGAENQSVACPSSIGKKCPICEYRAQLMKEGASWDDETVRALKPTMRNLYVVIPKGSKKHEEVPHIWDISQFLFQNKLEEEFQESEEYDSFPDLEDGYTLQIRFSEESFGKNKFADTSRIDFLPRKKPYDESILDEIPSLDDIVEVLSYKAIETLFYGGVEVEVGEEEAEEEERETPKSTRRRPVEEAPEDEDDDDDIDVDTEEEEDDEDEEEPEPVKPAKKAKKVEKKKKAKKKECPHGYTLYDDYDEYDECEDCEMWDECSTGEIPF